MPPCAFRVHFNQCFRFPSCFSLTLTLSRLSDPVSLFCNLHFPIKQKRLSMFKKTLLCLSVAQLSCTVFGSEGSTDGTCNNFCSATGLSCRESVLQSLETTVGSCQDAIDVVNGLCTGECACTKTQISNLGLNDNLAAKSELYWGQSRATCIKVSLYRLHACDRCTTYHILTHWCICSSARMLASTLWANRGAKRSSTQPREADPTPASARYISVVPTLIPTANPQPVSTPGAW